MDLNRLDTLCEGCGPDGPASPDTELAPLDLRRHMELMQEYREAIRIVTERFESLGAQARARMQHNPVHSVSSRLKTPTGIAQTCTVTISLILSYLPQIKFYLKNPRKVRFPCFRFSMMVWVMTEQQPEPNGAATASDIGAGLPGLGR